MGRSPATLAYQIRGQYSRVYLGLSGRRPSKTHAEHPRHLAQPRIGRRHTRVVKSDPLSHFGDLLFCRDSCLRVRGAGDRSGPLRSAQLAAARPWEGVYGRGGNCCSAQVLPSGSLKVTNEPHG
jgi:hypothetical protein